MCQETTRSRFPCSLSPRQTIHYSPASRGFNAFLRFLKAIELPLLFAAAFMRWFLLSCCFRHAKETQLLYI